MPRLLITTSVPSTLTAFMLPFASHFRSLGWQVDAAANSADKDQRLVEYFDAVHHLPWTRRPRDIRANLIESPRQLRTLVDDGRYDIVHAHDPIAAFVTRYALRKVRSRLRLKVAYTAHGFHFFQGNSMARYLAFRTLEEVAAQWTDALIVINREDQKAARSFRLLPPERLEYMPGIGVDLEYYNSERIGDAAIQGIRQELGVLAADNLLLMIAEFNPGKRHLDAVAAVAKSTRTDVVLLLAGVGPELQRVREAAQAEGIEERVRFLGYRDDIPNLMAASFATILPSEREGLPRAIMESLAMQRPVISTKIRGVTELVEDSSGVLVNVGDVDGMARAIDVLAGDPKLAAAMGAAGRQSMSNFDLRNIVAMHEDLYDRLLSRR